MDYASHDNQQQSDVDRSYIELSAREWSRQREPHGTVDVSQVAAVAVSVFLVLLGTAAARNRERV